MSIKKFDYYVKAKTKLEENNYIVKDFKEIDFGLQFSGSYQGKDFLIRIFDGKKGINFDYSQIFDKKLKKNIRNLLEDIEYEKTNNEDVFKNKSGIEKMEEAIDIIKALKSGANKITGEIYFKPYKNKELKFALKKAVEVLEKEKNKLLKQNNKPERNGESWTEKEEKKLTNKFESYKNSSLNKKKSINRLAKIHERTYGAIKSRLIRLGELPPDF